MRVVICFFFLRFYFYFSGCYMWHKILSCPIIKNSRLKIKIQNQSIKNSPFNSWYCGIVLEDIFRLRCTLFLRNGIWAQTVSPLIITCNSYLVCKNMHEPTLSPNLFPLDQSRITNFIIFLNLRVWTIFLFILMFITNKLNDKHDNVIILQSNKVKKNKKYPKLCFVHVYKIFIKIN